MQEVSSCEAVIKQTRCSGLGEVVAGDLTSGTCVDYSSYGPEEKTWNGLAVAASTCQNSEVRAAFVPCVLLSWSC